MLHLVFFLNGFNEIILMIWKLKILTMLISGHQNNVYICSHIMTVPSLQLTIIKKELELIYEKAANLK